MKNNADAQLRAWLEKYTPVEQAIMEARAKRLENALRRRQSKSRRFGDLCEATGGLAAYWRRIGAPLAQQIEWVKGDAFATACLIRYYGRAAAREVDRIQHAIKRPLYYEAENLRRRELAAARRKITRRTTENPCPTREQILEAWTHRRESHAAAIRFGSLIEDLECYLDNSLRLDERGAIVGRNGGVKRWLQEAIPALYLRYTTVMRFKAAAHKMRQITGIADPTPASRVIDDFDEYCATQSDGAEADSDQWQLQNLGRDGLRPVRGRDRARPSQTQLQSLGKDGLRPVCGRDRARPSQTETEVLQLPHQIKNCRNGESLENGSTQSKTDTDEAVAKPLCPVDAFVSNASDKDGNPLFDAIETIASTGFATASDVNQIQKTDGKSKASVAPSVELVRAQAIWREVVAGVGKSPTALFARLDALLDPERVEDANMLAEWRRKYENEITVRTKDRWWRRWRSRIVRRLSTVGLNL